MEIQPKPPDILTLKILHHIWALQSDLAITLHWLFTEEDNN